MTPQDNTHLTSLRQWGLITQAEHGAAQAPELRGLLADATSDEEALFKLMARGVVDEDDLARRIDALREADPGDGSFDEPLGILTSVQDAITESVSRLNKPHMDALLALSLIDEGQHAEGCKLRPMQAEGRIDGPARALMVLVNRSIVSEADFHALKAAAHAPSDGGAAPSGRHAVVLEAERLYDELVGTFVKAMASGSIKVFALLMLGIGLFVGLMVWVLR